MLCFLLSLWGHRLAPPSPLVRCFLHHLVFSLSLLFDRVDPATTPSLNWVHGDLHSSSQSIHLYIPFHVTNNNVVPPSFSHSTCIELVVTGGGDLISSPAHLRQRRWKLVEKAVVGFKEVSLVRGYETLENNHPIFLLNLLKRGDVGDCSKSQEAHLIQIKVFYCTCAKPHKIMF